jgi:sugar phosphate isomerase/epimerase
LDMRIGVSMWSYYRPWREGRIDIPGFIREAKSAGADGVELLDFFYKAPARERDEAVAVLAETGLPVPIFSVANNFAKPTAAERASQVDRIKFGVDEARFFGADVVRVFAGDVADGITFEQARHWIVEGLAEASLYAAEKQVRLALENHGSLAGRGDQVRGIIEDVRARSGVDSLGANPDVGNFILVSQPSHEAIREVARFANMVHFKDFARGDGPFVALNGGTFVGAVVGEGLVDLEQCILELKSAGFDGWLSVEYEGDEDSFTAVPRSIANARKYL